MKGAAVAECSARCGLTTCRGDIDSGSVRDRRCTEAALQRWAVAQARRQAPRRDRGLLARRICDRCDWRDLRNRVCCSMRASGGGSLMYKVPTGRRVPAATAGALKRLCASRPSCQGLGSGREGFGAHCCRCAPVPISPHGTSGISASVRGIRGQPTPTWFLRSPAMRLVTLHSGHVLKRTLHNA